MRIPHRNKSPYGWWVASYMECAVWDDERKTDPNKHYQVWENTIVLKARDRNAAYAKAVRLGRGHPEASRFESPDGTRTGKWKFLGLTSLLPIHDELEDGTEILWREYTGRPLKSLLRKVRKKKELETFLDD